MIVLIGFMGAGKTTIGHMLSERMGLPFLDSDLVLERHQGRTIKEIFATDGEPVFRDLEHETIVELLGGDDAVLALGGGATQREDTRRALRGHDVVYLCVSLEEALLRVGRDEFRPMLHVADVSGLYERRLPLFEECASVTVRTDGRHAEAITRDVVELLSAPTEKPGVASVLVSATGGTYRVSIGPGLLDRVEELLPALTGADQAFVVHSELNDVAAQRVSQSLSRRSWTVHDLQVPAANVGTWVQTGELVAELAGRGAHRHDLVVAVGGETLCESVAFASSVYHRGMRTALVPTTLTAQGDTCVGGKTAVSVSTAARVAGSWEQPVAVVSDVEVSARPAHADWPDGLAELAKHALVSDGLMLMALEQHREALLTGDPEAVAELVYASVTVKAGIVAADEREQGERLVLSYGHPFAAAIGHVSGAIPGAVGVGMMAAAYLSDELGLAAPGLVERHRAVIGSLGLPTSADVDEAAVLAALSLDKRYRSGHSFVLLRDVGQPVRGVKASDEVILAALRRLAG